MGRVNRGEEVPVPKGAVIYGKSEKVYDVRYGVKNPILIGYKTKEGRMFPNQNYYLYYSGKYLESSPDGTCRVLEESLSVGVYALVLAAAQKTGIYEDLTRIFGVSGANSIMDSVQFLLSKAKDKDRKIRSFVKEITFTGRFLEDLSSLLNGKLKEKDCKDFFDLFLARCVSSHPFSSVYLTADRPEKGGGGNSDFTCSNQAEADTDPFPAFFCAVCADGPLPGMPVSCFLTEDRLMNAETLRKISVYFQSFGIKVKGVLCGSSFCEIDSFLSLLHAKVSYVIKLKKNVPGFTSMLEEKKDELRNSLSCYLGNGQFGCMDKKKIFESSDFASFVSLIFDPVSESAAKVDLMDRLYEEKEKSGKDIASGRKGSVQGENETYIRVNGADSQEKVFLEEGKILETLKTEGFTAYASSEMMSAGQVRDSYGYRQAADQCLSYIAFALEEPFEEFSTGGLRYRLFVCFLACVLWFSIQNICTPPMARADQMIEGMISLKVHLCNGVYRYSNTASKEQEALLNAFGISLDMLQDFAAQITSQSSYGLDREDIYQSLPWSLDRNGKETDELKKKRPAKGQLEGSENKAAYERQTGKAKEKDAGCPETKKSKGGRPLGRKDSYQRRRSTKKEMEERRARNKEGGEPLDGKT